MNIHSTHFTPAVALQSLEWMVGGNRHLPVQDCDVKSLLQEGKDLINAEVDLEPWLERVRQINRALSLRQVGVHN